MPKLIQTSLSGGEISPAVAARVDIAKYKSSVAQATNMLVRVHGGMSNRTGFKYVAQVKDSTKDVRLIPFAFNTEQTYILEFGDYYVRVVKDGGQVLESSGIDTVSGATKADPCVITTSAAHGLASGDQVYMTGVGGMTQLNGRTFNITVLSTTTFSLQTLNGAAGVDIDSTGYTTFTSGGSVSRIFELATPYPASVLRDIKYVQSADVMTLCHPSYPPQELTRTDHDAWSIGPIVFYPTQPFPTGLSVSVGTTGSETTKYAVTAVNADTDEESLRGTGNSVAMTFASQANPCVVTTASAHSLVIGDEVNIAGVAGMTELNDRRYRVGTAPTSTTFTLNDTSMVAVNSTDYSGYDSGGNVGTAFIKITNGAADPNNTISWTAADGVSLYHVYRDDNGQFGFIGSTEVTTFKDNNIDSELTDTPPRVRNPFLQVDTYPSTVAFYNQRRVFANSNKYPQRIWMTQTANISNMATSSPVKDDDAIILTIASMQVNEIRHMVPLAELIVLTSGGEWELAGAGGAALTPSSVEVIPQTYYGSTNVQPLVSGANVLFIEPGQVIRDLGYRYETDSYTGNDISILARHLFEGFILTDWSFAQAPDSTAHCVRNDGRLLHLTYLKEQEIFGWTTSETRGDFSSCATVEENNQNILYVITERVINGSSVKYIERQQERTYTQLEDAFYVDAGLTYDVPIPISGYTQANPVVITATSHGLSNGDTVDLSGILKVDTSVTKGASLQADLNVNGYTVANVTTNTFSLKANGADVNGTALSAYSSGGNARKAITNISGLWHLEGQSVTGLANGDVLDPVTVTNGSVTLPNKVSRVHLGLPYTSTMKTLRLNVPSGDGTTIQARDKKISRLTVRTEKTMGMKVGPDEATLRQVKFGVAGKFGQPRVLFDGDKDTTLKPNWAKDGQFFVVQSDPAPLTILSVIPDAIVGGN